MWLGSHIELAGIWRILRESFRDADRMGADLAISSRRGRSPRIRAFAESSIGTTRRSRNARKSNRMDS